ncbi:MAG: SGNH/GDSL hydrolase family protein [Minwuia sp.]|uniref:SGNH/GDSL hydrolase family protein n=1 Tax=Minwuia sp. TaxID=2493630 RepID=UPI003A8BCE32
MLLTNERNRETGTPPAFVSHVLVLGDSIASAFRFGPAGGALLKEIGALSGLAGECALVNAGFGGLKLMDTAGAARFLDFATLGEAQALTDAKAIMGNFPAVDAAVISLGVNDLGQVEPAPGAIAGYDAAKAQAGLEALIGEIRVENGNNGYAGPTLPVILLIPGRDLSTATKGGAGQVWRRAALAVAAADAHCHPLDYHDVDLADGVHPSAAGYMALGRRAGRLVAKHAHGAAVGGPPVIQSIARVDDVSLDITFTVPSGDRLLQASHPSGWRVENAATAEQLRIARLDWTAANQARLVLHDGCGGAFRLFAPWDLVEDYRPEGLIRTIEGSDLHGPGFVLQSFEGVTP